MEISIKTGLFGKINETIFDSILGQMSDGIWENSRKTEAYWHNASIDVENNEVVLLIQDRSWNNPYYGKTENEIKKMFAQRLKRIVKIEEEDGNYKAQWNRANNTYLDYLSRHDVDVTVKDAYRVYDSLLGRKTRCV